MDGEDYDDCLFQVNQTYLYMSHYIVCNIHGMEFYIRWMQRLFSRIIEQRAYEEQPQGFKVYQKETLVCRWKKKTWWRTSNAQQKRGEDFYNIDIVSEWLLRSSGWWIANPWQTLKMTEKLLLGYVSVWGFPQCHELAGNKSTEFNHDIIQPWYIVMIQAMWKP